MQSTPRGRRSTGSAPRTSRCATLGVHRHHVHGVATRQDLKLCSGRRLPEPLLFAKEAIPDASGSAGMARAVRICIARLASRSPLFNDCGCRRWRVAWWSPASTSRWARPACGPAPCAASPRRCRQRPWLCIYNSSGVCVTRFLCLLKDRERWCRTSWPSILVHVEYDRVRHCRLCF